MSHYTALVITGSLPTAKELEEVLLPWHEYECTGIERYLEWVDYTEEVRAEWNTVEEAYRAPEGTIMTGAEDEFYREPTEEEKSKIGPLAGVGRTGDVVFCSRDWEDGRGHRPKVHYVPEGYEKIMVAVHEKHPSFYDYATDYHGYRMRADGSVGRMTNPNRRWDWYAIGGRWTGMLRVKPGARGRKGKPGLMGSEWSATGVDQCRVGDLDLAAMLAETQKRMGAAWDEWVADYLKKRDVTYTPSVALAKWWEAVAEAKRTRPEAVWLGKWIEQNAEWATLRNLCSEAEWHYGIPEGVSTREGCVAAAKAFSTFAVVKDGTWYERGKMGWWATVSDEKAESEWDAQFAQLIKDLPPDNYVTVVDCHI